MALKKRNIPNTELQANQYVVSKEHSAIQSDNKIANHPDVVVDKFDGVKAEEDGGPIDWDNDDDNPATGWD